MAEQEPNPAAAHAPSGWYADGDPIQLRWWDGRQWSNITRPAVEPARDQRGRRLLAAATTCVTSGWLMVTIAHRWVVTKDGVKPVVPWWAETIRTSGAVLVLVGIVCFILRWRVRRPRWPET